MSRRRQAVFGAILGFFLCLLPHWAFAQREHRVRPGQSLARIARRYDVSVANLAGANRLARNSALRPGQILVVPERGTHYVRQGETLASIARANDCSVRDLQRLNRLRRGRPLRLGQRLVLPGYEARSSRRQAEEQWGRPRRPGVAHFVRGRQRVRITLVNRRGRVRPAAQRRLRELMRQRRRRGGRLGPLPPRRLIAVLARISDHFGGRRIHIVSGYRPVGRYTEADSQHPRGHAVDIRIEGVPNTALRSYVRRTFQNVGVGYYPRSRFVHVDVRDRSSYWVDWSRPGQRPRYQRRGDSPPDDATPDEIARTGL